QEIIHRNKNDDDAWAALERVDPAAAQRLRRVAEIAPDPFVARRKRSAEELAGLEDMDEIADVARSPVGVSEENFVPTDDHEELIAEIEEVAAEPEETPLRTGQGRDLIEWEEEADDAAAPAHENAHASAIDPSMWQHEQDQPYRAKMDQDELLSTVLRAVRESWQEPGSWQPVLDTVAHASHTTYKQLWDAAEAARSVLGGPEPVCLIAPEGSPHALPLREPETEIAVHTGLLRAMTPAQLVFCLGRCLGMFLAGHVPYFHATLMATDRPARVLGACEQAAKEFLWDLIGSWFESHAKPLRQHAAALAHAWQLRCELSCDRAGLLACGNLEAACDAIARMTARTAAQASQLSWRSLVTKYKDHDAGKLAAIPVEEDPRYSERYAVYRIRMLRWWFTTDQYKNLAGRYRTD
ncbi:MAG: hypothetical protein H5T86_06855, partial [Armatimonadetes bacterium]|nr:hypothetical protein [Armatimonadota bacterium]